MNRDILRLAIPNIISNISVPLLSTVDTILMGHLSVEHLAALGIGSMIFVFVYGNFGFLRMGTTGLCAQAYGQNDHKLIANRLFQALFLALVLAFVLLLFQRPILELGLFLMNAQEAYTDLIVQYYDIRIWAAPALFIQLALFGWFFGIQNAKIPLYITLGVNGVNIVLSYLMVNVWHWGIAGVAYGTVVAQYAGIIMGAWYLRRYRSILQKGDVRSSMHWGELKRFVEVNGDIFIRTVALTFVLAFFYAQGAKESPQTLAMMVLLLQFLIWMSFAIDGFANATESLVGKYYGAKSWDKFYLAIRYNFLWGFGLAICFSIVYGIWGSDIITWYSSDPQLIDRTKPYLILTIFLPILSFGAFIWDGVFIGMTAVKSMRNTILVSMLLFLATFYIIREIDYVWALWGSFVLFFLFRALIQSWLFWKRGRELR